MKLFMECTCLEAIVQVAPKCKCETTKCIYIMWCSYIWSGCVKPPFRRAVAWNGACAYICMCVHLCNVHTSSVTYMYIPMCTSTGIKVEMPSALYVNSPFISDASDVSNLSTIHQASKSVSPCSVSEDQLISTEGPALTLDMMQEKVKVCNCKLCRNSVLNLNLV